MKAMLYRQYDAIGKSMGISDPAALARFVFDNVRLEEDREERRQERLETERRLAEAERRFAGERQLLREALQTNANLSTSHASAAATPSDSYRIKIQPFREGDDIDAYLTHFERVATTHNWSRDKWAARLVPLLEGAARDAYLLMTPEDGGDYDKLRKTLLQRFHLTAEYYRRQFRETRKEQKETFEQFLERLKTLLKRWFTLADRNIDDVEDVIDAFLMEQLLSTFSPDLGQFVRDHWPKTAAEAATLAHRHLEAKWANGKRKPASGNGGGVRRDKPPANSDFKRDLSDKKCHKCGKFGHFKRDCKKVGALQGAATPSQSSTVPTLCSECEKQVFQPVVEVRVNGEVVRGLRDTGADVMAVTSRLVREEDLTGKKLHVTLANSLHVEEYPVAMIDLDSPFVRGRVEVVVMDNACQDVIIGNAATFITGETLPVPVYAKREFVSAVQTRAQAKREQGEEQPIPVVRTCGLDVTPAKMKELQASDLTLTKAREWATTQEPLATGKNRMKFVYTKGTLRRVYSDQRGEHRQLCVPKELRREVMRMAHDTPMGGHLAAKKTRERIWAEFYWPGMCGDIRRYCQSCDRCQRMTPRGRTPKVPLVQMSLVDQPFERVAVDLVGPVTPASDRGNRFILVMIDYATRYPEAVALKKITAETVAEALWDMWSRLGIPREVLTDRGSQFTSDVMQEVYRLLAIKGKKTTPYHAQCNGLVERFNGTLKAMIAKLCQERPKTWDRFISAVLFAYREVPQASTGFAPFELLYGRRVRGPMAILRELWTHEREEEEVKSASSYVLDLRNRIEETCAIARNALEKEGTRQKKHFDKRAKMRVFSEGDRVLLLLPCKTNKLELAWRGPYVVEERVGEADYRVKVGTKTKLFHANLLKKYYERVAAVGVIDDREDWESVTTTGENIPTIPLVAEETTRDIQLDPRAPEMHEDLRVLADSNEEVLTDVPLRTTLMTCEIRLEHDRPVNTKQFPLPFSQRQTIKEEVDAMLRMGVIEPAASPYSSPIVLVKKKDGKIRFCVDFRKLNQIVIFDAEPMPDIDYLLSKLGNAQYLSKLDLAKGYWQVAMKESDKPKTAFTTPEGQYQWNVMPFGLKTAGAIFSRMMRQLLQPLNMPEIDNFMDDVLIATETKQRHLECLRALFARLQQVKLAARPSKCFLGFKQLEYLGYRVGEGTVSPVEDKMEKIRNTPRPMTKRQVRAFLGLAGFYRRFVPHFAEIALPLTEATKSSQPATVEWNDRREEAFQTLKERLCSQPVCCLPDLSKTFVLRTDASDFGLGAILLQDQGFGLQPIACASKKLIPAERNYATVEKECLAIVWGIEKFSPYLYGKPFIVQCDHQPLQHLQRMKTSNSRLMRWAMQLQPYNFSVEAIPGKDNVGADFLSRLE
jgi:transposase InsO family protein